MRSWLPSRAELARERSRRYAVALRAYLEWLAKPEWPPWPAESDSEHHAWVRAHWTILASDRFDVLEMVADELAEAERRVLAQDLLDCGEDREALRQRLADDGHEVWDADYEGVWWQWITAHWRPSEVEALERELRRARTSLPWVGDHRARRREHERAEVARLRGLLHFDIGEQEMAPYLAQRICGIRGRYRLTGMTWEQQHGITEADIDAP